MKYYELERRLRDTGCYKAKNGSNHPLWYSPITGKTFPMEEVKNGTLKAILRNSGVTL